MVKPLVIFLLFLNIIFSNCAFAQSGFIKYLPRNEDIDSIAKDYSPALTLEEINCPQSENLFKEASRCNWCVQELKPRCPDCCLKLTPPRSTRCTPAEDPKYDVPAVAFYSYYNDTKDCQKLNGCQPQPPNWPQVCQNTSSIETLNHCQKLGCPSTEPDGDCQQIPNSDSWICAKDHLSPKFLGCTSHVNDFTSPCSLYPPYYIITEEKDGKGDFFDKYKYTPRAEFLDCVNKCRNYTNDWDTRVNRHECCNRSICSDTGPGGYSANCDTNACTERVAFPQCDNYTAAKCAKLNDQAIECLLGGGCSECFREIDPAFSYNFVANSKEAMTIIWQIATTPKATPGAPTYFFTRVKVFEVSPDRSIDYSRPVHDSVIHQKSLDAAFSIYCATQIPSGLLGEGKAYQIRVFYFLPELPEVSLKVDINNIRLILFKIRE